MWVKKRHNFIFWAGRNVFRFYNFLIGGFKSINKYKFKKDENAIIVSNHQTDLDPAYLATSFNKPIYYVCTDSLFSHKIGGKIVKYCCNPIPKKKGFSDPVCIRNMMRVAKEKGCIGLFPEGNRSIAEYQFDIEIGTAKLIKSLRIPLIIYNIYGGYGTNPRFANKRRKGYLKGKVVRKYEVEEIKAMSDEELLQAIKDGIRVYDSENNYEYKSNKKAEYLERFFFVCPNCGSTHTIYSKGNYVYCKNCDLKVEYTSKLHFNSNNPKFTFNRMIDWFNYQKKWIREYDYNNNDIIFEDDNVKLYVSNINKPRKLIGKGKLILTANELKMNDIVIPTKDIEISSVLGGFKFNFSTDQENYIVIGNKRFNALKYTMMFNRIDTAMKEHHTDKYFTLED